MTPQDAKRLLFRGAPEKYNDLPKEIKGPECKEFKKEIEKKIISERQNYQQS